MAIELSWNQARDIKIDTTKRQGDNNATAITGFRRSGKTYIVYEAIEKLLQEYSKEEVIYLNFEDERIPLQTETLTDLLPQYRQLLAKNRNIYSSTSFK